MSKEYTQEQLKNAISGSNGNISVIAINLKCSWATARKYISENDELRREYKGESEKMLDKAESIVNKALDDDQDKKTQLETAKWILATKGYTRGYNAKNRLFEHRNALAPIEELCIGNSPDD